MRTGIYSIINKENNNIYIGSTINFEGRWKRHKRCLRGGYHHNPRLQSAWNKYGEDVFEFMVCEYVEDKEQLHIREQYWLDFHRMFTEIYNCGLLARNGMLGRHHTGEAKQQMSILAKKRPPISGETRDKIAANSAGTYPAFIHKDTGEIIPAGVNLSKLCREKDLEKSCMWRVVASEQGHHKGWMLLDKDARFVPGIHTKEAHQKQADAISKFYPAFIHRETGEIISDGNNLAAMCRERGLSQSSMWAVAQSYRGAQTHKGWTLLEQIQERGGK